jgi:replicative DNA helicase
MAEKAKQPLMKAAPNSKESEMMVLGCMLTSVNALNIAADMLDDFDFYYKEHQVIFHALKTAYRSDKPADVHLISEELKRQNKLEDIGGVAYLTTLAQYAGTSAYAEEYVNLIKNKSILRKMISAAQKIEKDALSEPSDVLISLDTAQALLFQITQVANSNQGTDIKDLISGVKAESKLPYLKELQERQNHYHEKGSKDTGITGEPTHFSDVDRLINGLNPSHLIIVAGRPAMGKTAFAINIAENVCFKNNTPVLIFSLEMSAEQLLHRIICSQAEVESDKIRTGSLSGLEYQRIVTTVKKMQKHTMIIDDQPGLKVTDLRARARRVKEVHNIGLIVIDYLQLLSGSGSSSSSDNRQGEISEISRMLKNLARELNVPVICASQLSRRVEERQGHRPMMSDLRESGSIEQDSDIIIFLLRREYYDPYDKPGHAEIIVAKNRHGQIGSIDMTYRKEYTQFANFTSAKTEDDSMNEAFSAFTPPSR